MTTNKMSQQEKIKQLIERYEGYNKTAKRPLLELVIQDLEELLK